MWPMLLDMTKEESLQSLRNLELEAYSHLVSALRAQGPLNSDKRKLLKDTGIALNISLDRHKAEVRRAISDERLNTIAYHITSSVTGQCESVEDWAQEGRRLVPLLPRASPQTAYSVIADEVADTANQNNKHLPLPSNTERKRTPIQQTSQIQMPESSKSLPFRIPEPPKIEESKKRKLPVCPENSSLAQHLLGPSKMSRIQQIYRIEADKRRQKTKVKTKEQLQKVRDNEQQDLVQQRVLQHQVMLQKSPQHQQQLKQGPPNIAPNGPKINVLQNISIPPQQPPPAQEEEADQGNELVQKIVQDGNNLLEPRPKLVTNLKSNANITFKALSNSSPGPSSEIQKTLKMCPARKPITKTVNAGQKLIVVSNPPTLPSNSILQRTLTIPFVKNISVKNFEKFKIITTTASPAGVSNVVSTANSLNSMKHKVVTVRTNPTTKKMFPLTQLQVLNKGSIKVLPLGGKIVGKTSTTSSPLYIMNTMGNVQTTLTKNATSLPIVTATKTTNSIDESQQPIMTTNVAVFSSPSNNRENGKSTALEEALKASGVLAPETVVSGEDYDAKIDEFHIQAQVGKIEETGDDVEEIHEETEGQEDTAGGVPNARNVDVEVVDNLSITGLESEDCLLNIKELGQVEEELIDVIEKEQPMELCAEVADVSDAN